MLVIAVGDGWHTAITWCSVYGGSYTKVVRAVLYALCYVCFI